jgi:hypothetical protein
MRSRVRRRIAMQLVLIPEFRYFLGAQFAPTLID